MGKYRCSAENEQTPFIRQLHAEDLQAMRIGTRRSNSNHSTCQRQYVSPADSGAVRLQQLFGGPLRVLSILGRVHALQTERKEKQNDELSSDLTHFSHVVPSVKAVAQGPGAADLQPAFDADN